MILLPFLAEIKQVGVGGVTSGILYNLLHKEIIIVRGLESYTTCHFHKYGWPNNTSQILRRVLWGKVCCGEKYPMRMTLTLSRCDSI